MAASGLGRVPALRVHLSRLVHTRPRRAPSTRPFEYGAYRCIGNDGLRFDGKAVCTNGLVRSDRLDRTVWPEVAAILNDPTPWPTRTGIAQPR